MKKLSVFRLTTFTAIFSMFVTITATSSLSFAQDGATTPAPTTDPSQYSQMDSQVDSGGAQLCDTGGIDGAGEAIDKNGADITGPANALAKAGKQIPSVAAISAAIEKDSIAFAENIGNCIDRQHYAACACLENFSPLIQKAITTINPLASLAGIAVNDSCSTFSKALGIAQDAMTAYTAVCGAMKAGCGYSCVQARDAVADMKKQLETAKPICPNPSDPSYATCNSALANYNAHLQPLKDAIEAEIKEANNKSVAGKAKVCQGKYAELAFSAVAGLASMAKSLAQSNKCDSNTNGTASATATNTDTCSIAANAQLPECICKANPRLAGCDNTLQKSGQSTTAAMQAVSSPNAGTTSSTGGLTSADLASTGTDGLTNTNTGDSSAQGAGAPVGGGSGALSGGSGGTGSGSAADSSNAKKALNANILGGAGGGGGGGSWGIGGGSGSSSSQYRPYLPGGEKDPNKAAGAQAWTKEVTGQGGKSNWEKVKDRYRDNNATLLNN